MVVFLDKFQLPEALERLKSWKSQAPYSWRIIGCIYGEIETSSGHFVIVDQWPGFNAICVVPKKDCKYYFFFDVMYRDGHQDNFLTSFIFDNKLWESSKRLENSEIYFSIRQSDIVEQLCQRNRLTCKDGGRYGLFVSDKDHLIPQPTPHGYKVTTLTEKDTETVHSFWEYSQEDDNEFVRLHLVNYPSVGIRDMEGNLAAWAVCYYTGEIGMLFVRKEHRRKGLGKCAIYELSKKLVDMDRNLFSHILLTNTESITLNEQCGFRMEPDCDMYFGTLTKTLAKMSDWKLPSKL